MKKKIFGRREEKGRRPAIVSPADGRIIPLSEVEDEVFSGGILGEGVAIVPDGSELYAPMDGVVQTVAETGHAISILADCGAEILVHCGIDTVALHGEGFTPFVAVGERVTPGKLLLKFDPALIRKRGYALTTPVVVVNASEFSLSMAGQGQVVRGEPLIRLTKK